MSLWPDFLPLAFTASRMTYSSVTGYALAQLINGQLFLMPIKHDIASWKTIAWEDNVLQEELLFRRMQNFDQIPARVAQAIEKVKAKRMANKPRIDKKHCLRPILIQEGDWVLIAEGGLGQDHSSAKKFIQQ
jgi:hypothetical protein